MDPKPQLYTLFTYKVVPPGQSFIAGIAYVGSTCYGNLKEIFGDSLPDFVRQESRRTSINLYADVLNDMEVAEVYFYHICLIVYYVCQLFNPWPC